MTFRIETPLMLLCFFLITCLFADNPSKKKKASQSLHKKIDESAFDDTDKQLIKIQKNAEEITSPEPIKDDKQKELNLLLDYLNSAEIALLNASEFKEKRYESLAADKEELKKVGLLKVDSNGEKLSDPVGTSQQLKGGSLHASSLLLKYPNDPGVVLLVSSYYLKAAQKQKKMNFETIQSWESFANKVKMLLGSASFKVESEKSKAKKMLAELRALYVVK